jgi:hypothetical protein
MIRTTILPLALLAAGCVPVVTHAPRVEPGLASGAVYSLATNPTLQGEVRTGRDAVTPMVAPLGIFARHGWTRAEGAPADFSLGVMVPLALPFSLSHPEVDAYLQLTPSAHPTVAAGSGILLSRSYAAPYAQAGYDFAPEGTVYTTQTVAFVGPASRAPQAVMWMPSAAVKLSRFHLFAQAGLGRERVAATDVEPEHVRDVRFLLGGMILEVPVSGLLGDLLRGT